MSISSLDVAALKQLGWSEDQIPTLYILVPSSSFTTTHYRGYAMIYLQKHDLPLWSGEDVKKYFTARFDINDDYILLRTGKTLEGKDNLSELGLSPTVFNLAVPVDLLDWKNQTPPIPIRNSVEDVNLNEEGVEHNCWLCEMMEFYKKDTNNNNA